MVNKTTTKTKALTPPQKLKPVVRKAAV